MTLRFRFEALETDSATDRSSVTDRMTVDSIDELLKFIALYRRWFPSEKQGDVKVMWKDQFGEEYCE